MSERDTMIYGLRLSQVGPQPLHLKTNDINKTQRLLFLSHVQADFVIEMVFLLVDFLLCQIKIASSNMLQMVQFFFSSCTDIHIKLI